nr:MAG TPA: NUMOD4 motif protein [Caudoviricetes sp.]
MEKQIAEYPQYTVDTNGRVFSNRTKKYLNPIITKKGYA